MQPHKSATIRGITLNSLSSNSFKINYLWPFILCCGNKWSQTLRIWILQLRGAELEQWAKTWVKFENHLDLVSTIITVPSLITVQDRGYVPVNPQVQVPDTSSLDVHASPLFLKLHVERGTTRYGGTFSPNSQAMMMRWCY